MTIIISIEIQGNSIIIPMGYINDSPSPMIVIFSTKGIPSSIMRTSLLNLLIILPLGF